MNTEAPKVYAAICAVMEDIGKTGIAKERKNQQQGYNFRGIDDVYNELNGLLAKHKLVLLPSVVSSERDERETQKGGVLFYTRLTVDFKVVSAEDGSADTIRTVGEAMDSGDKSSNKAQSAAYKYAAMMVFCIPTEGDNDADNTTHEVTPARRTGWREDGTRTPYSLRQEKVWEELERELLECATPPQVKKLADAWEAKIEKDKWPAHWRTLALEEFKKRIAFLKSQPAPEDDVFVGDPAPNYLLAG